MLEQGLELDLPTVQLRHALPDGSWHVDWMIAPDGSGKGRLVTFRLPGKLEVLEAGEHMGVERIADHRRAYLEYEGLISGGRGVVKRLNAGRVLACCGDGRRIFLHVRWAQDEQYLMLELESGSQWQVSAARREDIYGSGCACPS